MDTWVIFAIGVTVGLFVGGNLGLLLFAMLSAASDADDAMERGLGR